MGKRAALGSGCRRNFGNIVPRAERGIASRAILACIEVMTTERFQQQGGSGDDGDLVIVDANARLTLCHPLWGGSGSSAHQEFATLQQNSENVKSQCALTRKTRTGRQ